MNKPIFIKGCPSFGKTILMNLLCAHEIFKPITLETSRKISNEKPILIDVRGVFNKGDGE